MSIPPQRILMTADTVGGVWTYALQLTKELAKHGAEVCLATMGALPSAEQRAEAGEIENLRLFEASYKLEWMDDPWADVDAAGDWLLGLEDRLQPDAVHLNGYAHGDLNWQSPIVVVAHSCVLSWWNAVKNEAVPAEWSEYRDRVRRGIRAADFVVAPTRAMLRYLEKHYGGIPDSRVIRNGLDASDFYRRTKRPFVFAAGRLWDEAKNVAAIDSIAGELSWPVYVAGNQAQPGHDGHAALKAAKTLGQLSPGKMREWLSSAAIFASPAKYEPFGLSVLEAALSGCALVLGDIPSLRELWDGAAVFADPEDDDAIREGIEFLSRNDWMRNEMAWRARERALRYSASRMGDAYYELYGDLARTSARAVGAEVTACV